MSGAHSWAKRVGTEGASYTPLELEASDGTGYVYFMGDENARYIKVGWSRGKDARDVFGRIKQHKSNYFLDRLLAVVRGPQTAEARIHGHFKASLAKGKEIFHADALIPYVSWLRDQYFVSTTEEEFESPTGRRVVDPTVWLPGDGRVSTRMTEANLLVVADPWAVLPTRVRTGDDYYTPRHIMERCRAALGGRIDLDPASHVIANEVVQAESFFTKDQNGLAQPWFGKVYLNPPFSAWPLWVDKVLEEVTSGRVAEIVMLGATRTLTAQYFTRLLRACDGFCLISGRNAFWGLDTESDSPTDGHFLLYRGPHVDRFVAAVAELGVAMMIAGADADTVLPLRRAGDRA